MGSSLICQIAEIDHDVNPDWGAAKKYLDVMDNVDMLNLYSDILGLGEEYSLEDLEDDESGVNKSVIDYARAGFNSALESCQLGWENRHRSIVKIKLKKNVILLAAGESWGDNVPQCDDITLFVESGMAVAAGFY